MINCGIQFIFYSPERCQGIRLDGPGIWRTFPNLFLPQKFATQVLLNKGITVNTGVGKDHLYKFIREFFRQRVGVTFLLRFRENDQVNFLSNL